MFVFQWLVSTAIGWIPKKCGTDIHGAKTVNPNFSSIAAAGLASAVLCVIC